MIERSTWVLVKVNLHPREYGMTVLQMVLDPFDKRTEGRIVFIPHINTRAQNAQGVVHFIGIQVKISSVIDFVLFLLIICIL
jgi:hypothetical protein